MRPGVNGTVTSYAGVLRRLLDRRAAAEHDQVGERDLLAAGLRAVELRAGSARASRSTFASSAGSLTSQSFCGARRMRAPLAPPRLSVPRKRGRRRPRGETSCEIDRPESRILPLSAATSASSTARGRPRGPGPARAAAPGPTGRGSARPGPCRGAAACTRPSRTPRRARPGSRGSAARSARRSGSTRSARSVVSIIGACRFDGSCASGTVLCAAASFGVHCLAPAGLSVSSHSWPNRFSRKPLSHLAGVGRPRALEPAGDRVVALAACRSCSSSRGPAARSGAPSGSGPTCVGGAGAVASCRRCGRRR